MFQCNFGGLKTLPCLRADHSVDVDLSGSDLYVCDPESWCRLRELVRVLWEENYGGPCNGISTGCVLLHNHECRYEWTLHESSPATGAEDQSVESGGSEKFQWFLLLRKYRQVLEAFVVCQTLVLGNVDCLFARGTSHSSITSPGHYKLKMVVKAARALEFYSSLCTNLPYNDIVASLKSGTDVYRTPNFPEFALKIVPAGEFTLRFPEMECTLDSPCLLDGVVKSEEICHTNYITTLVANDANVDEPDLKWLKTEFDTFHFDEQVEQRDIQHDSHSFKKTSNASKRKKGLSFGKLMAIAKRYAALDHHRDRNLVPFPGKISGTTVIIECPICNTPADTGSRSAFLMMLRHISRRHLQCRSAAMDFLSDYYAHFIEYMKEIIANRAQKKYLKKLRKRSKSAALLRISLSA